MMPPDAEKTSLARDEAIRFLLGRIDYERTPLSPEKVAALKLDRMRDLLQRLDEPQLRYPIVHIAGTKGKGSTAAMIAAIASAGGYRTGLFTSPHLVNIEERFRVDGAPCSAQELVALVDRLKSGVAEMDAEAAAHGEPTAGPTYFEITTAMAMLQFAWREVDLAVLEVGMGGRLDATNVCQPVLSAITSISLDHTAQLGSTVELIAAEKAGIVKPGVPLVSGVAQEGARRVVQEICQARGSDCYQLGRDFGFDYRAPQQLNRTDARGRADLWHRLAGRDWQIDDVALGLLGRHQAANASVAAALALLLGERGWRIGEQAIRAGLADVRWPARLEILRHAPTVVIDSAHNLASVESLLSTLDESFTVPRDRRTLIFATSRDKDVQGMLGALAPGFGRVVLTRYTSNPRSADPSELATIARGPGWPRTTLVEVAEEPNSAWDLALRGSDPGDLVCITGSCFIAGELRARVVESAAAEPPPDAVAALRRPA